MRIAGTRAFAHDALLDRDDVSAEATVTLDVIAERVLSALRIAEGVLADTDVGFEWTDDGRLVTQLGHSSPGGPAPSPWASLRRYPGRRRAARRSRPGAGPALLRPRPPRGPPAPRPPAPTGRPTVWPADGAATADGAAAAGGPAAADGAPAPDRDAQAVGAAYRAAHPDESEARETCASLIPELARGLADALRRVPGAADGKARAEALGAVRAVEAAARAQAGALDEHFRAGGRLPSPRASSTTSSCSSSTPSWPRRRCPSWSTAGCAAPATATPAASRRWPPCRPPSTRWA